jgi:hypothetical protein
MRRMMFALSLACLVSMTAPSVAGDTGTYRIQSYKVRLTPRSNGTVAIDYYQRWLVTGGHIPWITVGTPNPNFTIAGSAGAVAGIQSIDQGGWSGVRLDLDRDYRPGQTFEVRFSILQRRLFYSSGNTYKMEFTPGWYDRAVTDTLRISVKFFADLKTVTAQPQPLVISDEELAWEKTGLGPGERFSIGLSFPVGLFPAQITPKNKRHAPSTNDSDTGGVVAIIVIGFLVFFVMIAVVRRKGRYSGGRMYYGGRLISRYSGAKGRHSGLRGGGGGGRSAGGGGGFGGSSISCACACVACACACACAGGGGAGCSRKLEHTCPACESETG